MKEKAKQFADQIGEKSFPSSDGWIQQVLDRNQIQGLNLRGEGSELSDEEYNKIIDDWKKNDLNPVLVRHNIPLSRVYNGDQTGLFFNKMPTHVYVRKENSKTVRGCKAMKSKDRITLMVCTAANGDKIPLAIVGKSQVPQCLGKVRYKNETRFIFERSPIAYTSQTKAWFTQEITLAWVKEIFWPCHLQKHGDVIAILILDNCTAHNGLDDPQVCKEYGLPAKLIVIFLPPNVTSRAQPADMCIIACLKVGYRVLMLEELLQLYDSKTFECIDNERSNQKGAARVYQWEAKPISLMLQTSYIQCGMQTTSTQRLHQS